MKMYIITAHAGAESLGRATESWMGACLKWSPVNEESGSMDFWGNPNVLIVNGKNGMLPAYQYGYNCKPETEILAYLHDDTIINDLAWTARVLKEFRDPKVGLVGFGGATRHGDPGMYRKPYEYQQLARAGFKSNMVDAEHHGERFTGECDVAVLDGFALIVRREVLEKAGGWPLNTPIGYVCYDYWLSCMTRRLGYKIRLVGVPCQHLGGQTFVKLGMGRDEKHWKQYIDSHQYIYDEFKDVLPYEVPR